MGHLRFDQVNVVVSDVAGAVAFLRSLGAEVQAVEGDWASHHVGLPAAAEGFDGDIDSSGFASRWGGLPADFNGVVVNFRTEGRDDVDAAFDRAVALGADGCRSPYDAFWGSRYAVVQGPGPIVVGLMSPPDPARRSEPPPVSEL